MTTVSPKFAFLPNGIIRHIISYTGATYKKRNGKYIGQIPKNDPRYAKLKTIPNRNVSYTPYTNYLPWSYATSYIELKKCYGQRSNAPQQLTTEEALLPTSFGCCYGSYNTYSIAITTYPDEGRETIGYYHIIQTAPGVKRPLQLVVEPLCGSDQNNITGERRRYAHEIEGVINKWNKNVLKN